MEKTKNYIKTIVVVEPTGAVTPMMVHPIWDQTEDNVRMSLREDAQGYGARSDVQSVVECNARFLLSVMYRSGTVKIISYSPQ